jgi:branched-chain amino acid transport system ATP-binding protein
VLFGLSLEIREGEAVTLLGRNGMGKTTTVRSIL